MSRRITDMRIISGNRIDSWTFCEGAKELVREGFQPFGVPYTVDNTVFREFVKYEYIDDYEVEDEYENEDEATDHPQPFDDVDFFMDV